VESKWLHSALGDPDRDDRCICDAKKVANGCGGKIMRGIRWGRAQSGRSAGRAAIALALAIPVGITAVAGPAAGAAPAPAVGVAAAPSVAGHVPTVEGVPAQGGAAVVRAMPGRLAAAEQAVLAAGGTVTKRLAALETLTVQLPAGAAERIADDAAVHSVTGNRKVQLHRFEGPSYGPLGDLGTYREIEQEVLGAADMWNAGFTGQGVDVALIDSGVVPVNGLRTPNKVYQGPDLSFESQSDNLRYQDTYGHGTHMAGLIAGRDDAVPGTVRRGEQNFVGVAPDSRLVSVKVADASGATDVSQVLAAIDWVVTNRKTNGLNIRVLNLSFGTDSTQDYKVDPLAYAAEVAWKSGIVVVAAAGNRGSDSERLTDPAYDPTILAVGAADNNMTPTTTDDSIPDYSSRGDGVRNPDLVAYGTKMLSLRSPGSQLDMENPQARVMDRLFRGSGTSQAAAMVSGSVALLLEQRPTLTPDQVKKLMVGASTRLPNADSRGQGAGVLNLSTLKGLPTPSAAASAQNATPSTGLGSLDAARGSTELVDATNGEVLEGENDIFGVAWTPATWAAKSAAGTAWNKGTWNGTRWSGDNWSGTRWSGVTWSGTRWSGTRWSGTRWSGADWTGTRWSGSSWTGTRWSGSDFSGTRWSGTRWSGGSWG
jgi:serine protease AprX